MIKKKQELEVASEVKSLKSDLDDALARNKILEEKLGVEKENSELKSELASKREGTVNIGQDKLTNIAAAVLSLQQDLEGQCNLDPDEMEDLWHESFIDLLEKAQHTPCLNPNIAWCEDDEYIDKNYDDAEVYLAYKRMVLNLGDISTFVFRLLPEFKDDDVWYNKCNFEDRFETILMRKEKQFNSDQSSDDDNKVGDFRLSFDSDDVNIDDV